MQQQGVIALLRGILTGLDMDAGVGPDTASHTPSEPHKKASLGAVMERLDERAYGILLLLLALPCCLPFVYLLPQIVALPMLALCVQLAAGRVHPWLPSKLAKREFAIADFIGVLDRSEKYVGWFEKLAHRRLAFFTRGISVRVFGALLAIPCASILIPLPSTNTIPGIGVAIASVGLIERDGLMMMLGLLLGLAWVGLLIFLGAEGISLIKTWLAQSLA